MSFLTSDRTMPFVNLDDINFYKPPTQGPPSFDKLNRLSDARVLLGNEQPLNLEGCNGWAGGSKDTKINEDGDRTGSEIDEDLVAHQTWVGGGGEGSWYQDLSTLASNQPSRGEADDFPSIDELLSPTKQNRAITATDPNSDYSLEGVGKVTVIDLTGLSSPRAGASQEIPIQLDQFDGVASSVGCDDCDANNSSDIIARADAREEAPQSVENGSERRASFDAISPLSTSAAGLVDDDAGDFVEDEANEGVDKDVHALVAEGQKYTTPRGDLVAHHSIESLHDGCQHWSPHQACHGGSSESAEPSAPENRRVSSITGRGEGGGEDQDQDKDEDEDHDEDEYQDNDEVQDEDEIEEGTADADDAAHDDKEDKEGGEPRLAKRHKASNCLRPGLADRRLPEHPLRQPYRSPSSTSSVDDLDRRGVARCSGQHRWSSTRPPCQHTAKTDRAPSGDIGDVISTVSSVTDTELREEINRLPPSQEWPLRGFLKRKRIGSEELFTMEFTLDQLRHQLPSPASSDKSRRTNTEMKTRATGAQSKTLRRIRFTKEEDERLIDLRENRDLPWKQIKPSFPGRTIGTLQVHYSTKLKGSRA